MSFSLRRSDWRALTDGGVESIVLPLGIGNSPASRPTVVFPGAFNPLHDGHLRMAAFAGELLQDEVAFEISVWNVDKQPLEYGEVAERVAQCKLEERIWITRAATFVEKALVFPRATFVVGVDTLERIADEKYYANDARARDAAISGVMERGCRFLVFGRSGGQRFVTLNDIKLPARLRDLCEGVSEEQFRLDVSSTAIRREE